MSEATHVPCKFLAQLFGITTRRIQQLAKEEVIPKAVRGEYPLLASVKGYVQFLQNVAKRDGSDNEEIIRNRARFEKARADDLEMDVALKKGTLILAVDVEDELSAMVTNFRARVLAIPSAVAAQGTGINSRSELEGLVKQKIHEALHELSQYNPQPSKPTKNRAKRRTSRKTSP